MDNPDTYSELVKNGWSAPFVLAYIYREYSDWKKEKAQEKLEASRPKNPDGTLVSMESLHTGQKTLETTVKENKSRIDTHMTDEALEEGRFAKLEGRMDAIEKESGHLFNQSKTLFDKFDKIDAKMDTRFDTLMKILLESKNK